MKNNIQSVDSKILASIYGHRRGWVFTPDYFKGIGSRNAVASALKRYKQAGLIRRLGRNLYNYPEIHPELGMVEPSLDSITQALAGRDAIRLQPSGASAANLLGLSTQVPMRVVYLTDGPSKIFKIGNRQIVFKRTTPRNMAMAGKISGLIVQALRYLGKNNMDKDVIISLDKRLDNAAKAQLLKDIRYAPAWIADIFHQLADRVKD